MKTNQKQTCYLLGLSIFHLLENSKEYFNLTLLILNLPGHFNLLQAEIAVTIFALQWIKIAWFCWQIEKYYQ